MNAFLEDRESWTLGSASQMKGASQACGHLTQHLPEKGLSATLLGEPLLCTDVIVWAFQIVLWGIQAWHIDCSIVIVLNFLSVSTSLFCYKGKDLGPYF